jgi:small-conductance mechanosensitive channel
MYGYERIVDWIALRNLQMRSEHWLLTELLVWSTLIQLAVIGLGMAVAYYLARPARAWLHAKISGFTASRRLVARMAGVARSVLYPVIALVLLGVAILVCDAMDWPYLILRTWVNLLAVWIIIRVTSSVIENETLARLIAVAAFAVATLNILDLVQPTILFLDSVGTRFGGVHLTVFEVLKAGVQLAVLLWAAMAGSRILEHRMRSVQGLTPSFQVLTGKLIRISLITVAFLIALSSVGIDLTAFAVFTGAVGVGVGFGLQKLVSNLISGVILLLDRSIKPGDVIEVGETFGWVSALNARYASVTTRDGKEWLIPNEDLITQRVTNLSFSSEQLRLLLPFGISYDSDVRLAIRLAVEAATEVSRVLTEPAPVCRLMGFGDSSVDLELRIWINDPVNGVVNVRSEILLNMWDKFHENGISIPFPQRDLHIKSGSELNVTMTRPGETAVA